MHIVAELRKPNTSEKCVFNLSLKEHVQIMVIL